VNCNLETEPTTHKGTEYAVFNKTVPETFLKRSMKPFAFLFEK